ncbi:hypothetical protein, partial [Pseudomonas sp. GM50]|uniref:hypothetical protein n=1 Tax=Pseudomonas sp. GM50 TaxID=1144332 RepID=UPI001EE69211
FGRALKAKDRSLRQLLHWDGVHPVGAAEGCDLLILEDQKIAAFGSSYITGQRIDSPYVRSCLYCKRPRRTQLRTH